MSKYFSAEVSRREKIERENCRHSLIFSSPAGTEKFILLFCKFCSTINFCKHHISFSENCNEDTETYSSECFTKCPNCGLTQRRNTDSIKFNGIQFT